MAPSPKKAPPQPKIPQASLLVGPVPNFGMRALIPHRKRFFFLLMRLCANKEVGGAPQLGGVWTGAGRPWGQSKAQQGMLGDGVCIPLGFHNLVHHALHCGLHLMVLSCVADDPDVSLMADVVVGCALCSISRALSDIPQTILYHKERRGERGC